MNKDVLHQLLEKARSEVAHIDAQINDLERQRAVAAGKIEAFEVSLRYISEIQQGGPSASKAKTKRSRLPSEDWKRLFSALASQYTGNFGYDDIIAMGESLVPPVQLRRGSLRTKMASMASEGYVDRIGDGRFRMNEFGKAYFGLPEYGQSVHNENGPPNGGPEVGDVAASQVEEHEGDPSMFE